MQSLWPGSPSSLTCLFQSHLTHAQLQAPVPSLLISQHRCQSDLQISKSNLRPFSLLLKHQFLPILFRGKKSLQISSFPTICGAKNHPPHVCMNQYCCKLKKQKSDLWRKSISLTLSVCIFILTQIHESLWITLQQAVCPYTLNFLSSSSTPALSSICQPCCFYLLQEGRLTSAQTWHCGCICSQSSFFLKYR